VKFQVLTAANMKMTAFRDTAPSSVMAITMMMEAFSMSEMSA
jgi:hypothetical protein